MRKPFAVIALCFLTFITAVHWSAVSDAVESSGLFLLLALRDGVLRVPPWSRELVEYWIAAGTWVTAAFVCVFILVSPRKGQPGGSPSAIGRSRTRSIVFLGFTAFVALTAPFLAPVGPNVQGVLSTTRLLPPLSPGRILESPGREAPEISGDRLQREFLQANARLLRPPLVLSGEPSSPLPASKEYVFWLGTDDAGRDVLSRVLYGTRVSLALGLLATLAALLFGTAIGLLSGLGGKVIGALLMRFADLMLAIPSLVLIAAAVAFIGHSVAALVLVLALTGWMSIARVVRAELLSLREREFSLALRLLQIPARQIVLRHFLPHLAPLLLTAALLQFGSVVLAEAALSFLGLGIQPPTPSWGTMMHEAAGSLQSAWWLGVFPGALLAAVLIAAQTAGEGGEEQS